MGMFSNIVDRIFHHDKADAPNYQVPTVPSPLASNIPSAQASGGGAAKVDASQVLSQLASKSSEKLNYKNQLSIFSSFSIWIAACPQEKNSPVNFTTQATRVIRPR